MRVGGEVVLDGPEGRHAAAVQRVRAGETIQCVDGGGRRITGSVATVQQAGVATITVAAVTDEPEAMPQITAVQAIAKGDRGERAVQMLTELESTRSCRGKPKRVFRDGMRRKQPRIEASGRPPLERQPSRHDALGSRAWIR